jgi:hypothetical protein
MVTLYDQEVAGNGTVTCNQNRALLALPRGREW